MPISGPHTYIETIEEHEGHWEIINPDASPTPLLANGRALADLTALKTAINAKNSEIAGVQNQLGILRALRDDVHEVPVRADIFMLRAALKAHGAASGSYGAKIFLPRFNDDRGNWDKAIDLSKDGWTRANAALTPDITIGGGTTLAQFTTKATDLQTVLTEIEQLQQQEIDAIKEREALMEDAIDLMQDYDLAVQAMFGPGHPHTESVPRLWPLPGSTPDPLLLAGELNSGTNMAELTITVPPTVDVSKIDRIDIYRAPFDGLSGIGSFSKIAELPDGVLVFSDSLAGVPVGLGYAYRARLIMDTGNYSTSNTITIIAGLGGPPPP